MVVKKHKGKLTLLAMIITVSSNTMVALAETTDSIQQKIDNNKNVISDLQNKKDNVTEDKNQAQSELKDLDDKIEQKNKEINEVNGTIKDFEQKIGGYENEISSVNTKIDEIQSDINEKEADIKALEDKQQNQKKLLTSRIRNYYKVDLKMQYIGMLLSSQNIFDIFTNMASIVKIMNLDKKMISDFKEKQKEIESEKQIVAQKLTEQNTLKEGLETKKAELEESKSQYIVVKNDHEGKLKELQDLQNAKQDKIASLESNEQNLNGQIGDLISFNSDLQNKLDQLFADIIKQEQEREREQQAQENNASSSTPSGQNSGAGFIRPVEGPITDPYGPRTNPVTFAPGMHNGVDFGAGYGAGIKAVKGGTVVYSGWNDGGYGNLVIIDHGDGVMTLYGHCQSIYVTNGQVVQQGNVIGEVGSTGMSTGPHLHFEVRINGVPQQPMNYLPY